MLRFSYKVARALLFYSSIFSTFSPSLDRFYGLPLFSALHLSAPLHGVQILTQTDLIGLSLFEERWTYLMFSHRFRPKIETKPIGKNEICLISIKKVISVASPPAFQKRSLKCLRMFGRIPKSAIKTHLRTGMDISHHSLCSVV